MNSIHDFIERFIDEEFISTKSRFNKAISDEEQIKQSNNRMSYYFHSIIKNSLLTNYERTRIDLGEKSLVKYRKPERVLKRTLFQIKKYQNPVCGNVLKRHLKDNILCLCYTSNDEQIEGNPLGYSRVFAVAETDEGLKIIDSLYFYKSKVTYTLSPEDDTELRKLEHVIEPGELLEVQKFQAPIAEESLKDYNQD